MTTFNCSVLIFVIVTVLSCVGGYWDSTFEEDVSLTYRERMLLDKFRARVISILPRKYMRSDFYLLKWLRGKNFDINQAEKFLKQNLRWRKENDMDDILKEDFSDILAEYPAFIDTFDKNGAPVVTVVARHWDLRNAAIFDLVRLRRFTYRLAEEASMKVRAAQLEGKNVTRYHFLINLEGFSYSKHLCAICMVEIVRSYQTYENHFPGMADLNIIFNASPMIQLVRDLVFQVISGRTRANLKIFGENTREWKNYLLRFIDAGQLTTEFGGTRIRSKVRSDNSNRTWSDEMFDLYGVPYIL